MKQTEIISQHLEQFVAYLQKLDHSSHTITAYRHDVLLFFTWLLRNSFLEKPKTPPSLFLIK